MLSGARLSLAILLCGLGTILAWPEGPQARRVMVDLGKRSIVRLPGSGSCFVLQDDCTHNYSDELFDNDAFSSGDVWPNNNIFISSIDDFHEPSRNLRLVKRRGQQLTLNGGNFRIAGPNIYWLRVREALAIAVAMGANTVRLMSCGVSVGSNNPYNLELSNGNWQDVAWDIRDCVIYAAGQYGLRVVLPLTDNYNYYHGGKYSLLGFSGASTANKGAAFYTDANTINIYKQYIQKFLVRTNVYNGKRYADDPTIQAWETGNELGGYTNAEIWPPASWTSTIYPRKTDILSKELGIASSAKKGFLIGEFDWTAAGGGVSRSTYLGAIEQSGSYLGSMMWSVFGHDAQCCNYLTHNDGYSCVLSPKLTLLLLLLRSTVLKAQNSAANQSNALLVVQHFYRLTGRSPPVSLPGVACPQPIF
ncbi:(1-4)-beta-mannan endohydrolase [Rhodotorula toruloides]|uniref:mannan endo-1,4-beta-mannosidase n=1 Tax=Rhodotorula toruloides TaxID=5286 RepID=A0A511KLB0_RHOTO|nr:(1-4)-beta-mannan endohydrolase [Rhodotorula toruloides]